MIGTAITDRIHTAKQLNRTSGKILAEAREHAVTVVTEGEDAVVMQNRADAARQAQALPHRLGRQRGVAGEQGRFQGE